MMTFRMALRSIGANKMRALLTMLGIIIGVVALVVLVSLVNGATSSVTNAVSSLGSDMLTITISDDKGLPIDLETLAKWRDELPGRSFEGVVTAVNTGRSNSGGNSKYLAEVTVKRTADMFDGMNASCLVTIETFRDVLTIPAAALCDEGGGQLVYTALSRDKSELSNPVPIETGFSDGESLEILSGLSEGDTVWYKIFDTPEYGVTKAKSGGTSLGSLLGGSMRGSRR